VVFQRKQSASRKDSEPEPVCFHPKGDWVRPKELRRLRPRSQWVTAPGHTNPGTPLEATKPDRIQTPRRIDEDHLRTDVPVENLLLM
jgi:hypothetical protein